MASVNKVIIVGNLGKDPETRYTPNGDQITNASVATTDTWKDKATGERRESTEWHRVVFFGKLAEIAGQYLKKGSQVYIEGRLRTRKWQGQDGQDRYTTEINADALQMLGKRDESGDSGAQRSHQGQKSQQQRQQQQNARNAYADAKGAPQPNHSAPSGGYGFNDFESDIPF